MPAKTNYAVGEGLDITGLVVTASYSDSTTAPVKVSAANITGFNSATAGSKTLTVTYNGKTATFTVTVSAAFVAVTDITGVPAMTVAGVPLTLTGTVTPSSAINKTIVWEVKNAGTTGAAMAGGSNVLNTVAVGTVTVTASIASGTAPGVAYIHDFTITVISAADFVPVAGITGVPTETDAGTPLILTGTVTPASATYKTIVWSIQNAGTTGATISGNTLNTLAVGTVSVRATISNGLAISSSYTQNFTITVNAPFVSVISITNVPSRAYTGTPLPLSGTVTPSTATNNAIIWSVKSGTGVSISGNMLNTTLAGTVVVTATIQNGLNSTQAYTKDFTITVYGAFVPVTNISGVTNYGKAGVAQTLSGTVVPSTATNKTITWTVKDSGTTGAKISGSSITFSGEGAVVITATIASGLSPYNGVVQGESYIQDFTLYVDPAFVAVTGITAVPTTAYVGNSLLLSGTVTPSNANYKTINWSIQSGTGVSISNNNLNTTSASVGVVVVTATITNGSAPGLAYTQDFPITVLATLPSLNLTIDDFTFTDEGIGVFTNVPSVILSKEAKSSQTIEMSGLSDVVWYIGNIKLGTGNTVTLNALNFTIGTYALSITFTKDGKSWLSSLPFTITE